MKKSGQTIVAEAFAKLTPERQEQIMHEIGICTGKDWCLEESVSVGRPKNHDYLSTASLGTATKMGVRLHSVRISPG